MKVGEHFQEYLTCISCKRCYICIIWHTEGAAMANHIKATREALGLSQGAFAQALGVDTATVSRWERGLVLPHWENMKRVIVVLDSSLEALWPELKPPTSQESPCSP